METGYHCDHCRNLVCRHGRRRSKTHSRQFSTPFRCQECMEEDANPKCKLCGKDEACQLERVKIAAAPEGPGLYCLDCRYPACRRGERRLSQRSPQMFASFNCAECGVTCRQCNTSVGKSAKPTANPRAPRSPGLYCNACRFPPCKHERQRQTTAARSRTNAYHVAVRNAWRRTQTRGASSAATTRLASCKEWRSRLLRKAQDCIAWIAAIQHVVTENDSTASRVAECLRPSTVLNVKSLVGNATLPWERM